MLETKEVHTALRALVIGDTSLVTLTGVPSEPELHTYASPLRGKGRLQTKRTPKRPMVLLYDETTKGVHSSTNRLFTIQSVTDTNIDYEGIYRHIYK